MSDLEKGCICVLVLKRLKVVEQWSVVGRVNVRYGRVWKEDVVWCRREKPQEEEKKGVHSAYLLEFGKIWRHKDERYLG